MKNLSNDKSSSTLSFLKSLIGLVKEKGTINELNAWDLSQFPEKHHRKIELIKARVCNPFLRIYDTEFLRYEGFEDIESFIGTLTKRYPLMCNEVDISLGEIDLEKYLDFIDFKKRYTVTDLYVQHNDLTGRFLFNEVLHRLFNVLLAKNYLEKFLFQKDSFRDIFLELLESKDEEFFARSYPSDFFVFSREEAATHYPVPRAIVFCHDHLSCYTTCLDINETDKKHVFKI